MKQLSIDILRIMASNNDYYLSSREIENKLERVSKRAILNELKLLQTLKRIKILGKSSSTVYKISNNYFDIYEELRYIYQ
ncbi:hypothetical protein [Arcobacter sp. FWKO B]|uniref:hypothetical protein n=1 Tax=Arcobacter sp. FWKO B TaxID=2593672 RepID=UPI0018A668BD|nr:hypothetical protein [Arcobacter sp. FWKO B]QOG11545.1 hypothetical protein FWKOB_02020 [Arcobacter sp. FWKO B]